MPKTYAQVMKQIEVLSREADSLKQKEVDRVVSRMKEAIRIYGLTAGDLGLANTVSRKRARGKSAGSKAAKAKLSQAVRFRDDAGNTWVGRGPRPQWLRDALAGGKRLSDFAV